MSVGRSKAWGYRPHLDGLRVVAVYLVVGFHAGMNRFHGGFIGVDVFFVLSGYLVTNLLLKDLEAPEQQVRFGRFYGRRARRLLPAAAVNLIVTAVVFASVGSFLEMDAARGAIRAAALYFANWHFIGESADYFAADVEASPVLHYWSLSVEEQFYLLWPLLLGGLWWAAGRLGRHRRRLVQVVVLAAGLASAAAALNLADDSLNRAYYGTDTRAYQLLAGAFIALAPGLAARVAGLPIRSLLPIGSLALLGGLVVAAVEIQRLDPIQRGVLTTVLMVGLLVSLEASDGGIARWALSRPWLVYLGKISYGTYLWHWLVIVVLQRKVELAPQTTAVVTAVLATGLASLSYQILEQPIRMAPMLDRMRGAPVAAGLAISALVGLVIVPITLDRAEASVSAGPTSDGATGEEVEVPPDQLLGEAWNDFYDYGSCEASGPEPCPLHDGDGMRALVVGESHAATISPMLTEIADEHDLDLRAAFLSYCPWPRGIAYHGVGPNCLADQERTYEQITRDFDPDIVFLAHRPIDDPLNPMEIVDADGDVMAGDSEAAERELVEAVERSVESFRADDRTVVMFEPLPLQPAGTNSLTCMTQSEFLEQCRYVATEEPGAEALAMRALSEADEEVVNVPMDELVCAYHPICDPVEDGMVVWRDDNHLTITYATSLADEIDAYLVEQGVFD